MSLTAYILLSVNDGRHIGMKLFFKSCRDEGRKKKTTKGTQSVK